jgi:2-succinyl-5-enolpyruvyl-6-hydroxy-3-cyclohexene-1-carboxylate synthase
MTKKPKRKKKKAKKAKAKLRARRRARVKPHRGPFQIELPLQMPLFPHEPSAPPPRPGDAAAEVKEPEQREPKKAPPTSGNSQPSLLAPSIAS